MEHDSLTDLRFHSQLTRMKKSDSQSYNVYTVAYGRKQVTHDVSSALTEEYLNLNETGFPIRVSTDMRVNLHMTFFR